MQYADILKMLPPVKRRVAPTVTEDEIYRKARAMTLRGYCHTVETVKALEAYLQGYGVLLSGGMGIGKTFFFETVNPEPIAVLSFSRCHLWKYERLEEWLEEHRNDEIVLDDIGFASSKGNNYGTQFDALQVVLDQRLTEAGGRTHVTTNCTNDELIQRFDARLVDRLYQTCKCFALPGRESQREADVNLVYINNTKYAREMGREEL